MAVDLSKLPAPDIIDPSDFETIKAAMIAKAIEEDATLADALGLESEPGVKIIEVCAYRELLLRAAANDAGRQCMLAFASGANLINLAANNGVTPFDGESDDDLRARAAEAPDGFSVAGPKAAYEDIARNSSPLVADVQATSPAAGQVQVAVLSTDPSGIASGDLLATVTAALTGDDVRPFTDDVSVVSAAIVTYPVTFTLYIASGLDTATVLAAAEAALAAYAASRRKIGRGVAVKGIDAALMAPGVENLVRTLPAADIEAVDGTAAIIGDVTPTVVVGGDGV